MGLFGFRSRKSLQAEAIERSSGLFAYGAQSPIAYIGKPRALENSAFWACVMNLARLYATLPWHVYESDKNGDRVEIDKTRPLSVLLREPNPYMDSYTFRFIMGINFELHGIGIAIIQRSSSGIPMHLYPVSPTQVVAYWKDGELYYVLSPTGTAYRADDVLAIRNTPENYTDTLSPLEFAYSDLELEVKCKAMQREYYESGSVMGNIVSVPQSMSQEQKDVIKAMFNSSIGRYRTYVVDERIKIAPIQIPTSDIAKLSEAQKWNTAEVARRFNVPPFFIGDTTGTYNNSEQQGIQMVSYCLQPRVTAWETALTDKLCYAKQYVKFNLSGLMRGDHATRSAFYHNAIMDGWMSVNEVRRLEDLPGIGEEGDVHFFPMNYASLGDVASGKYASSGMSAWDLSTESRGITAGKLKEQEVIQERILITDKKAHDLAFIQEAQAPAKSSRAKLQALIKKQLKQEIAKIRSLIATGQPVDQALSDFNEWLNENAKEMQPQYKAIYLDVLKRMLPVVKKETGLDKEVDEGQMDQFASDYSTSFTSRHVGYVFKRVKQTVGTEDFEDACAELQDDFAISEAEEEVNRSSNADSVWLFGKLGVTTMHVVASVDACPFCQKIDGKVVDVDGYVLQKGTDIDDGNGEVRHIKKNYRHPPFHTHCECGVAPGR